MMGIWTTEGEFKHRVLPKRRKSLGEALGEISSTGREGVTQHSFTLLDKQLDGELEEYSRPRPLSVEKVNKGRPSASQENGETVSHHS